MEGIWWTGHDQKLTYRTDLCPGNLLATDVKVEVSYSGVCGSDFSYMKGNMGKHNAKQDGVVLGHEFSGTIVEVGTDVDDLKIGDRVAVDPNSCCGHCPTDVKYPQFCEINKAVGVKRDGGWARFCVVPRAQVYKIPDDLSLLQAALSEPFSCVLRGWMRIDEDHLKQKGKALVEGAGIIGSLFCCLLRHHGFDDVTVAEINEDRREAMKKFLPLNYKVLHPDVIASGDVDFDIDGFHLIIDCTGNVKVFQEVTMTSSPLFDANFLLNIEFVFNLLYKSKLT